MPTFTFLNFTPWINCSFLRGWWLMSHLERVPDVEVAFSSTSEESLGPVRMNVFFSVWQASVWVCKWEIDLMEKALSSFEHRQVIYCYTHVFLRSIWRLGQKNFSSRMRGNVPDDVPQNETRGRDRNIPASEILSPGNGFPSPGRVVHKLYIRFYSIRSLNLGARKFRPCQENLVSGEKSRPKFDQPQRWLFRLIHDPAPVRMARPVALLMSVSWYRGVPSQGWQLQVTCHLCVSVNDEKHQIKAPKRKLSKNREKIKFRTSKYFSGYSRTLMGVLCHFDKNQKFQKKISTWWTLGPSKIEAQALKIRSRPRSRLVETGRDHPQKGSSLGREIELWARALDLGRCYGRKVWT